MENNVLVSVFCEAYNQERFIAQCLDGILAQQTTFCFEILVHDDASTDKTPEIIKQYADKYPDLIKPIFQTVNQHSQRISIWQHFQLPRAKGRYIAICEGDDYWVDVYKLQKQVDFLENNSEYGMVYTRTLLYSERLQEMEENTFGFSFCTFPELLKTNGIPTLTVCFQADLMRQYYKEIVPEKKRWRMGDYPLWLWISYHRKIQFMQEATAVYRVLGESQSHSSDMLKTETFHKSALEIKHYFINLYDKSLEPVYEDAKTESFRYLFFEAISRKCYKKAFEYTKKLDMRKLSKQDRKKIRKFNLKYIFLKFHR